MSATHIDAARTLLQAAARDLRSGFDYRTVLDSLNAASAQIEAAKKELALQVIGMPVHETRTRIER